MAPLQDQIRTEQFAAFIVRLHQECPAILHRHTVPFFSEQNGEPVQFGTGVLLQLGNSFFILTAAHVLDCHERCGLPLFVMASRIGGTLISLDGAKLFSSELPVSEDRRDDQLDVGFLKLTDRIVSELLPSKEFLYLRDIEMYDPFAQQSVYMTAGYPNLINQPDRERKALTSSFLACGSWPYTGDRCGLNKFDPKFGIALEFSIHDLTDNEDNPLDIPPPHGMSGCGIWRLAAAGTSMELWKPEDIKLVGIERAWDTRANVLRGVKIIHAVRMLVYSCPKLRKVIELNARRLF